MVESALDFFNGVDLPSLGAAGQAECLRVWSRLEAKRAVAEADLIGAFGACDGPRADGQKSLGAWIAKFTRCTDAAARGQVAAAFRIRRHPHVRAAQADGAISVSYGRWICEATARFYPEDQDAVEEILVQAAASGAVLEDLTTIATAALRKLRPGGIEKDEAQRHAERGLTVSKTLDGVGRVNGDLTADATALAETVIGALAVKAGPEDTRTKRQRRHDAFAEAMRRLAGSDLLPERGSKPQVKVDMDLATLRRLPGSKQAEEQWIERKVVELARRRLHGQESIRELLIDQPSDQLPPEPARPDRNGPMRLPSGPARLETEGPVQLELPSLGQGAVLAGVGPISDGLAAALACDSTIAPTVTGAVDHHALTAMTDEWLHAHGFITGHGSAGCEGGEGHCGHSESGRGRGQGGMGCRCGTPISAQSHARLQRSMLRWAIEALSGPGGLASYLRTSLLDGSLAGSSIVLDAGKDDKTIPASLERLVRRRDRRCRFPGCDHPPELSQVHHIIPRSKGGPAKLWNLLTLRGFHHLIAVHTWGWTVQLNPDGTTTATGPDGRTLQEHDPPGDPPLQAA